MKGMTMIVLRLFLAVVVFGAPCMVAAMWGARFRTGVGAFFLAWMLTPILTGLMVMLAWPFIAMAADPNSDGSGAIILPFLGIVTGLGSGIAAVVLQARLKRRGGSGVRGSGAP
jgi:hypothetical protein